MCKEAMGVGVGGTMVLPTGVALLQSEYVAYVEMNSGLYGLLCILGGFVSGCLARYVVSVIVRRYKKAIKKAEACE